MFSYCGHARRQGLGADIFAHYLQIHDALAYFSLVWFGASNL